MQTYSHSFAPLGNCRGHDRPNYKSSLLAIRCEAPRLASQQRNNRRSGNIRVYMKQLGGRLMACADREKQFMGARNNVAQVSAEHICLAAGQEVVSYLDTSEARQWHGSGVDQRACVVDEVLSNDRRT